MAVRRLARREIDKTREDSVPMSFRTLPRFAAWQHRDAREGFEVAFLQSDHGGYRFEGTTTAVEDGEAWTVGYVIGLDSKWLTRGARVWARGASGPHELTLDADGSGRWWVSGAPAPHLDGCLDVDLESSALTNALPVHRLGLTIGQEADAPAAYVRAGDLRVERLEQSYVRVDDAGDRQRYDYSAPGFGFKSRLRYDESGLVLDYRGIAVRAA
jgi:uncharacterized protein